MIKFSIITPVYNRADCIARCIDSVIKQKMTTEIEYEHVIVDDGSKDNTKDIIQEYTTKYKHINFITFPQNKGTNAARNAAIKKASGDYCIILDSDDYFVEDALNKINECIKKQQQKYKHYLFTPNDRYEEFCHSNLLKNKCILLYEDFLSNKISGDFIHVIKTEIIKNNPFDESLRIYEGVFFLRFYKETKQIAFNNTIITIRERGRDDSVSKEYIYNNKKIIRNSIKAIEIRIEWFKEEYIKFGQTNVLYNLYLQLVKNYLLLDEYKKCSSVFNKIKKIGYSVSIKDRIICFLRLGFIYRNLVFLYFITRYKLLKHKIK